ncbi:MAG: N-acetylmuramoyl-L-alanine amidase [Burkholderiaceae bacterium]
MSERIDRRGFIRTGLGSALLTLPLVDAYGATILAVRVWPAPDYTRVTLELDRALFARHEVLSNPPRLIVDLDGVDVDGYIRNLISRVRPDDPAIGAVRIGNSQRGSVRLVFDLKAPMEPELFTLPPVAQYRHRLVIDLHPAKKVDPLIALLNDQQDKQQLPLTATPLPATNDPLKELIERHSSPTAQPAGRTVVAGKQKETVRRKRGTPAPISRRLTIAIDAGHGGEDPGALGHHGTHEKDVVLPIAAELRELIRRENGMRAFMTRDGDYFVPLDKRVDKARRVSADLFISIHADAASRPEASGASVYVLSASGATSAAARWLANKENAADRIGGIQQKSSFDREARRLLLEMSAQRRSDDSMRLAGKVLEQLNEVSPLHKQEVESAGFVVLKTPDIPSILVETAFLSNPDDEKRLRSAVHQRKLAAAIFEGIREYLGIGQRLA